MNEDESNRTGLRRHYFIHRSANLGVLLASAIAHALGGKLNEGNIQQVLLLGIDIGRPLTAMFVCGWLALITIPSGLIMLVGFTIWWIVQKFTGKK